MPPVLPKPYYTIALYHSQKAHKRWLGEVVSDRIKQFRIVTTRRQALSWRQRLSAHRRLYAYYLPAEVCARYGVQTNLESLPLNELFLALGYDAHVEQYYRYQKDRASQSRHLVHNSKSPTYSFRPEPEVVRLIRTHRLPGETRTATLNRLLKNYAQQPK